MNIQVQTSKIEEAILDELGFSDNEKHVIKHVAAILEQDTRTWLKEELEGSVEGLLRDVDAKDLHITKEEQEQLSRLWHHPEPLETQSPILKELGIKETKVAVMRRLAEADKDDLYAFCRTNVIMMLEGTLLTPEVLGSVISDRYLKMLKKED